MDPLVDAKLPPDVKIVREVAAPTGWYAYYLDHDDHALHMLPVILWVTVEYDDYGSEGGGEEIDDYEPPNMVQEIRPFVMMRPGRIVDAQEPLLEFLTILGPGVSHLDLVRRLMKQRHPDLRWPEDATAQIEN